MGIITRIRHYLPKSGAERKAAAILAIVVPLTGYAILAYLTPLNWKQDIVLYLALIIGASLLVWLSRHRHQVGDWISRFRQERRQSQAQAVDNRQPVRQAKSIPPSAEPDKPFVPDGDDTQEIPINGITDHRSGVAKRHLDKPEPYNHIFHWWYWFFPSFCISAVGLVPVALIISAVILLNLTAMALLIAPVIIAVVAVIVYRKHWEWQNRPITCSPDDGILRVVQKRNMWLLLRGSSDDTYTLGTGTFTLFTPTQSWLESFVFKSSQTLILKKVSGERQGTVGEAVLKRRYVVNVDSLLAIESYRQKLNQSDIEVTRETNELLRELLRRTPPRS